MSLEAQLHLNYLPPNYTSIRLRNTLGIACQVSPMPAPPRPQNMCIYSSKDTV